MPVITFCAIVIMRQDRNAVDEGCCHSGWSQPRRCLGSSTTSMPVDEETRPEGRAGHSHHQLQAQPGCTRVAHEECELIGIIVPGFQHETFHLFIKHTEQSVEALGYNLVIGSTSSSVDTEERLIENLLRRNIDGIIFSRVSDNSQGALKLGSIATRFPSSSSTARSSARTSRPS